MLSTQTDVQRRRRVRELKYLQSGKNRKRWRKYTPMFNILSNYIVEVPLVFSSLACVFALFLALVLVLVIDRRGKDGLVSEEDYQYMWTLMKYCFQVSSRAILMFWKMVQSLVKICYPRRCFRLGGMTCCKRDAYCNGRDPFCFGVHSDVEEQHLESDGVYGVSRYPNHLPAQQEIYELRTVDSTMHFNDSSISISSSGASSELSMYASASHRRASSGMGSPSS